MATVTAEPLPITPEQVALAIQLVEQAAHQIGAPVEIEVLPYTDPELCEPTRALVKAKIPRSVSIAQFLDLSHRTADKWSDAGITLDKVAFYVTHH